MTPTPETRLRCRERNKVNDLKLMYDITFISKVMRQFNAYLDLLDILSFWFFNLSTENNAPKCLLIVMFTDTCILEILDMDRVIY